MHVSRHHGKCLKGLVLTSLERHPVARSTDWRNAARMVVRAQCAANRRRRCGLMQLLYFRLAAHEPSFAAQPRRRPRTPRSRAHQVIGLDGSRQALYRHRAEWLHLDVPSARRRVSAVRSVVSGLASCSMRAVRWVVWPTAEPVSPAQLTGSTARATGHCTSRSQIRPGCARSDRPPRAAGCDHSPAAYVHLRSLAVSFGSAM
jgi:hypothetical protein